MTTRNTGLDQIKAVACLLIIGHHLAFYGPMANVVRPVCPEVIQWLYSYGRMAVQVFLVLGGYFAAAALAPLGHGKVPHLWPALWRRYARLSLPFSAALACAVLINETVRNLGFDHPSVSATPAWGSILAHLLLIHSIGGWESLSAGVWYVAIDFQLYACCLLWLWLHSRSSRWAWLGPAGVAVLTAASAWYWNRLPQLDVWAVYFLGAYGLGMMAWWALHSPTQQQRTIWLLLLVCIGAVALLIAWRLRIAIALATACALVLADHLPDRPHRRTLYSATLAWVGQRSYSIFLIHFPMTLLVSAEVHGRWPQSVVANSLGMLLAVLLSIAAGAVLYEASERGAICWRRIRNWHLAALAMGMMAVVLKHP